MKTPVNFELAKLLKEKGFDAKGDCGIYAGYPSMSYFPSKYNYQNYNSSIGRDYNIHALAPTIADVVMWLYEEHGIWIAVVRFKDHASDNNEEHTFRHTFLFKEYKSPTEAYEGAIEYTLKNLINQ